jgi:hypothetical protein
MMLNHLHFQIKAGKTLVLIAAVCSVFSLNATGNIWGLLGKDFTGAVIDHETKEPIEGAYVLALYRIVRSGPAATTTWCVKSAGMFTGKDGKYRFPIKELNGLSPQVYAIKPDYILMRTKVPPIWNENSWLLDAYQGWDVHLKKKNKDSTELGFNAEHYCGYAKTREDAAASVQFMKLLLEERKKYRPTENAVHADLASQIQKLESLPSTNP